MSFLRTAAVICEYNPFHEGHAALLRAVRERAGSDGAVLCLMSGDFVQRGEPAVYDKYTRAKAAIENGADLVLELPYPWSASVAEQFSAGAISILHDLGAVNELYFGSERADDARLETVASRLTDPAFEALVKAGRRRDRAASYPRLLARCYLEKWGEELDLQPNEILGVSYLCALKKTAPEMTAHALPMLPGVSASEKRKEIFRKGDGNAARLENGGRAILAHLVLGQGSDRFSKAAPSCATLDELFEKTRHPTDTDARLRRELLSVLLGNVNGEEKRRPLFTVLLAANARGTRLLKELRKTAALPVITKQARAPEGGEEKKQYALYVKAQNFYASFATTPAAPDALVKKSPFVEK